MDDSTHTQGAQEVVNREKESKNIVSLTAWKIDQAQEKKYESYKSFLKLLDLLSTLLKIPLISTVVHYSRYAHINIFVTMTSF